MISILKTSLVLVDQQNGKMGTTIEHEPSLSSYNLQTLIEVNHKTVFRHLRQQELNEMRILFMPQTESKLHKQSIKYVPSPVEKDVFNPFPDLYEPGYCIHRLKKPAPKIQKKPGKCFQLMLICQKLLKPFSSHKSSGSKKINNNHKEKSKSTPQINIEDRIKIHKTFVPIEKVDASIQTNIPSISDGNYHLVQKSSDNFLDSTHFLKDNEMQTEDYWDLDIDSAIVGDYNSVSELSLDEEIDPHYATIKMLNDVKLVGKIDYISNGTGFNSFITERSTSNASSPKSGVYSKINKCPIKDEPLKFKFPIYNYLASRSNSKLNFDQIMMIKNQLGLSRDMYAFDSDSSKLHFPSNDFSLYPSFISSNETPDLPKRNYGSSVINFIAKLREEKSPNHSFKDLSIKKAPVTTNSDDLSRICNIYSPIWHLKKNNVTNTNKIHKDTPASEPTIPRRSSKTIMDQLNPVFKDDSSEEASSISFYSPLKNKYSYPRNFSENYSFKTCLENQYDTVDKTVMVDEIGMFRHMDSEIDVSLSHSESDHREICVPSDLKHSDICFSIEDKLFLEPLMEGSFEEDYFLKDIKSSLEYINV